MENYAMNIALVQSYIQFRKLISKQVQSFLESSSFTQSFFQEELSMQRLTLIRRLSGETKWKPEELESVIKALEKAQKKAHPQYTSLVKSYIKLTEAIPSQIEAHSKGVKKGYFYEQLHMGRLSFYRRLKGEIQWEPEEILSLLNALNKAEKINR